MCRGVHLVMFTRPLHTVVVPSVQSAVEQFWLIFGIAPQKMGKLELKCHLFWRFTQMNNLHWSWGAYTSKSLVHLLMFFPPPTFPLFLLLSPLSLPSCHLPPPLIPPPTHTHTPSTCSTCCVVWLKSMWRTGGSIQSMLMDTLLMTTSLSGSGR